MILKSLFRYVKENCKSPFHLPFMSKTFSKGIMRRPRFYNKYLKSKTDESKIKQTKQRNYCVSLIKKSKKKY